MKSITVDTEICLLNEWNESIKEMSYYPPLNNSLAEYRKVTFPMESTKLGIILSRSVLMVCY